MKRIIFTTIISLFITMGSFATIHSGSCGDELMWRLDTETGVLTISGTGAMADYFYTSANITTAPWGEYAASLKSLVLSEDITHIGKYAFWGCTGFEGDLVIPNSVKTMGEFAFRGCTGFKGSLTMPNSIEEIKDGTFAFCSGFTGDLAIPNSVKTIGNEAFSNCRSFTGSLKIPDTVESIGNSAFSNCRGFTGGLTISSSVTEIRSNTFFECSGFSGSLIIHNSVTKIRRQAFYNCSGFTGSLTIGSLVTEIEDYAFYNCFGFASITSNMVEPPTIVHAFNRVNKDIPLYVPQGAAVAYKTTQGWSEFNYIYGQTVSFVTNGGTDVEPITVYYGAIIAPPETNLAGYTLAGWFTDEELTIEWNFDTDAVTEDMTLYAKWTEGSSSIDTNTLPAGVYANANGTFTVDVRNSETFNITVVDVHGRVVKRETAQGGRHIVNIGNQPAGVYMFVVDNGRQKTMVKVVKR